MEHLASYFGTYGGAFFAGLGVAWRSFSVEWAQLWVSEALVRQRQPS